MDDEAARDPDPTGRPRRGQSHMLFRWKKIRQVEEGERGLMAEDPLLLRPEPARDEVFVVFSRIHREAEYSSPDSLEQADLYIVVQELVRDPDGERLRSADVPSLRRSNLVGAFEPFARHACNLNAI